MSESQVQLVEPKAFSINLPSIGAPVTIRTQRDEIVVLMRLTLRPRNNVMDIDLDVSTGGDRATMTGVNENATTELSGNRRTV